MTSNDLVVVLPGITGSTLGVRGGDGSPASANLIWAPSAGAVWKLLTGGNSILKHALPDGIGDENPGDGVEPVALMPDVHVLPGIWTPIRGYDVLVNALEKLGYKRDNGAKPPNLIAYAYDWRLSNRYNGERLKTVVEPALERLRAQGGEFSDARAVFICHSMGGLVARWYIEKCGGAEVTRKLITLGTPWRGATDALEQLVNGVKKGIGPLSIDLTAFSRSMPSLFQLLPEYACISNAGGYAKTTEIAVPNVSTTMVADAMAFHTDLQAAEAARAASRDMTHMVLGIRQPTQTTVTLQDGKANTSQTFGNENDYGDGTVTLTGAVGLGETLDTNLAVRVPEQHTNLQCNQFVLDQVQEILTAQPIRRRDLADTNVRAVVPDLLTTGQALKVSFDLEHDDADATPARKSVTVTVRSAKGKVLAKAEPTLRKGHGVASFSDLPPGTHSVTIAGTEASSTVRPVTSTTVVWPKPTR
ncbi:esterase/lipase family protein [Monashia sp. NPDC004114]